MGFLNLIVKKYGSVIAGDYKGCPISCDGIRVIFQQKINYCFTKDDVANWSVTDSNAFGGEAKIEFMDGKKSLVKVDAEGLTKIKAILF